MKIAICDDDQQCSGIINILLQQYASRKEGLDLNISIFNNGHDLLDAIADNKCFDICILDIFMPGVSGIELGTKLRNSGYDGLIIYLTSSREHALDSYKVKAFNYVLKPVVPENLYSILDEAVNYIASKPSKSIIVKTKDGNIRISTANILYVELCKRILIYHLADDSTIESIYIRVPFSEAVQEILTDSNFAICGTGNVINLSQVTMIGNEKVIFSNGSNAFFSKKICNELRAVWMDY